MEGFKEFAFLANYIYNGQLCISPLSGEIPFRSEGTIVALVKAGIPETVVPYQVDLRRNLLPHCMFMLRYIFKLLRSQSLYADGM